jgi:hypothetical protein
MPETVAPRPASTILLLRDAAAQKEVEVFMMAFDSNLAPIVGQQITRNASNGGTVDPRITLLEQRADAGECDLVAKLQGAGGVERGFFYV